MDDNKKLIIFGAGLFFFFLSSQAQAASPPPGVPPGSGGTGQYIGPPGSLNESYLGIPPTASNRGIRNNNPGNIKFGPSQWLGKVPQALNTDAKVTDPTHPRFGQPTFEQSYTWPQGIRMMIYLIKKYINTHNANSINLIIDRWAAGGNENYKNYLATRTGKTRTQVISATDEATVKKIVQSIANFENGQWGLNDPEVIVSASYDAARGIL